jgi:hypothetical protein
MCPESKLVFQIWKILATSSTKAHSPDFMFEPTPAAAYHNLAIFTRHAFDYTKVMRYQQGSTA